MVNQVILIGRITKDLEKQFVVSNSQELTKVDFDLAVNQNKDKVDFIKITAFGKVAENMCQFLQKGSKIFVEARISVNKFQDKDGNKRTVLKIIAKNVVFLDKKQQ